MRILHVLDHSVPVHSAYARRTLSLLRQQRALGWHTIQLTGPAQGKAEAGDRTPDGWHFFRTPPGPGWLPPALLARRMAARLRHAIRLARPDILHAHPPAFNAVAALWAGWRCGVPVLVEARGDMRGLAANCTARAAAAVVADSHALRADLVARGVAPRRISVIPPAVDLAPLGPPAPSEFRTGPGPLIAYAGPLREQDGLGLLLAALAPLWSLYPGMRLVAAGSGPLRAALAQRAANEGGAVSFPGSLDRARIAALIAAADLLVYPAMPTASLAAPAWPLQAMAHGALVLASDTVAHRELIDHGRNGVLFEAGSVASLGEALQALLAEPGCMQPLRERARAFAAGARSWEVAARCYGPVYKRLLAEGAR